MNGRKNKKKYIYKSNSPEAAAFENDPAILSNIVCELLIAKFGTVSQSRFEGKETRDERLEHTSASHGETMTR